MHPVDIQSIAKKELEMLVEDILDSKTKESLEENYENAKSALEALYHARLSEL